MRVIVFVKATEDSETGVMPEPAMLAAMGKFNQELIEAGVMTPEGGDGLKPSSHGKRVAFDASRRVVMDRTFAETKEVVAGLGCGQSRTWTRPSPG